MENQESQTQPDVKPGEPVRPPRRPGFQDYPSLTTIVFLLILASAIALYMPFGINHQFLVQNITSWSVFGLIFLAGLRWFLTEPEILIDRFDMHPVEEIAPEVAVKVRRYAAELDLKRLPVTYYTENLKQRVMAFGTFRRNCIVFNTREIDAYRQLGADPSDPRRDSFDVILVHELAHLVNGDNWKYRLSRYIVWMALVVSIGLLLSIGTNSLSQQVFLMGAPVKQAEILANLPLAFILQAALFYMSGVLGRVRELYADARAKEFFGTDAVLVAFEWHGKVWSGKDTGKAPVRGMPALQPAAGTSFLSNANLLTYRQESLIDSVFSHRSQLEVLFASGLAIGTNFGYLSSNGFEMLVFETGLLAVFLGVLYLLPFNPPTRKAVFSTMKKACIAAGVFSAGVLAMGVVITLAPLGIQALLGIPSDYIGREWIIFPRFYGYILINGFILAIALAGTIPVIGWCKEAIERRILPRRWASWIMILPVAHGVALFALVDFVFMVLYSFINNANPGRLLTFPVSSEHYAMGGGMLLLEILFILALGRFVRRSARVERGG